MRLLRRACRQRLLVRNSSPTCGISAVIEAPPSADALEMTDERRAALERLFGRIGEVASLPTAAHRILKLTEDEDASTDQLRDAIQGDPVFVARLLRRLNSSYYSISL